MLKITLKGPPASGKTRAAERIVDLLKEHHRDAVIIDDMPSIMASELPPDVIRIQTVQTVHGPLEYRFSIIPSATVRWIVEESVQETRDFVGRNHPDKVVRLLQAIKDKPAAPVTSGETEAPGYHVWCPESGMPNYRHFDLKSAVAEAMRLSDTHPGSRFFVMAPVLEFCTPEKIIKEPLRIRNVNQVSEDVDLDDMIPF